MNPPSAWAVAVRDAPKVAELCWTHPSPKGPKGRFDPGNPNFWAIWSFSPNKEAAKSVLLHLSQPASVEKMVAASGGYDLPAFEKLTTLKTWRKRPPKGTSITIRRRRRGRSISARRRRRGSAPDLAQATMTKMIALHAGGVDRQGDGLGGDGAGRLHAELDR
jgi:hypothetical protein